MKLALVLGDNGSGKGYSVHQVTPPHQLMVIDDIRSDVLGPFRPFLVGDEFYLWNIWNALIPHFEIVPTFAQAIENRYGIRFHQPIVAEGGLLAHQGFRESFLAGLKHVGYEITEQKAFWIDPPIEKIVENRRQKRKRDSDLSATPEAIRRQVEWYRGEARKLAEVIRFDCTDDIVSAINDFLSGD